MNIKDFYERFLTWLKQSHEGAFLSLIAHIFLMLILSCIFMGSDAMHGVGPIDTALSFTGDDELVETLVLTPEEPELEEEEEEIPEEPEEAPLEEDIPEPITEPEEIVEATEELSDEDTRSEESEEPEGAGIAAEEIHKRRQSAGGASGSLLITMAWNDGSDIDLHVTNSSGEKISYRNKRGRFGILDLDANAGLSSLFSGRRLTSRPVENYVQQTAEPGFYFVTINLYKKRVTDAVPYTLGIWVEEGQERLIQGVLDLTHRRDTYSFEVQADGLVKWIDANEYRQRLHIANEAGEKLFARARHEFRRGQAVKSKELLVQLLAEVPPASAVARKARLALEETEAVLTRRRNRLR